MPDVSTSRPVAQQKRSRRTEHAILHAALRVLVDTGENNLTMSVVSERAGVSVGSIYRRFGSRDELMIAMTGEFARGFRHQLTRKLAAAQPKALSSPQEIIGHATTALARTFQRNARPFGRLLLMGLSDPRVFGEGRKASLEGSDDFTRFVLRAEHAIRRPNPEIAIDHVYQVIYGVCSQRITQGQSLASRRHFSWDDMIDELIEMNVAYLLNPPISKK